MDEITLFYLVRSATDNQTLDSSAEFGSTCSSESASSQMKTIQSKSRHKCLMTTNYDWPDFEKLAAFS